MEDEYTVDFQLSEGYCIELVHLLLGWVGIFHKSDKLRKEIIIRDGLI
jgi:hypothetical protein